MNSPLSAKPSHKAYNWVNLAPKNFDPNTGMRPSQERRRTSLKEQSILEAAFRNNILPNKRALEELSEKLSMPIRAVQVWFQNKRQNTRRKETHKVDNSTGKMAHPTAQVTYQKVNQEANMAKLETNVVIQETERNVVHLEALEASQNDQQEVIQNNKQEESKADRQDTSSCSQISTISVMTSKPTHSATGAGYVKSRDTKCVTNQTPKPSSRINSVAIIPTKRDRDLHIKSTIASTTITPTRRHKSKRSLSKPPIEVGEPSRKRQRASTLALQTPSPSPSSPSPPPLPPSGKRGMADPPTEEERSRKRQRASTQALPTSPLQPFSPLTGKGKRPNRVLTPYDNDDSEKENIAPYGPIHRSKSWCMPLTIFNKASRYPDLSDITNIPLLTPPAVRDAKDISETAETAETPNENEALRETMEEKGFEGLLLLAEAAARQEGISRIESLKLSEAAATGRDFRA